MNNAGDGNKTNQRRRGKMSEQRLQQIRLEISCEAAHLFWEQGVTNTTGEQIADAVGVSVSTIWRYFRNKESCAEPVLTQDIEEFVGVLRGWPRELSLEDRLIVWATERPKDSGQQAYDLAVRRLIVLSKTEPAIQAAWLMACRYIERELVVIIASRLNCEPDTLEVRLHAAATASVIRVFTEDIDAARMAGADTFPLDGLYNRITSAVRVATGGALGDPIEP